MSVMELYRPNLANDLKLTPQAKTVLRHLERHGSMSPGEADRVHGITRLASCIHEIRTAGHRDVTTEMRRDDMGHKYAHYILVKTKSVN